MYCPGCGLEAVHGSKFCKRCGGSLSGTSMLVEPDKTEVKLTGPIWAMSIATTLVGLGGLGISIGTGAGLAARQASSDVPELIVIFGSMTTVTIVALLVWQLSRFITIAKEAARSAHTAQPAKSMPGEYARPQLTHPPTPVGSVTDATTRNFDPAVYKGSQSGQ